jgi:hypothetical protein
MLIIKDDWVHQYTRIMVDEWYGIMLPILGGSSHSMIENIPSGYVKIAIENGHL